MRDFSFHTTKNSAEFKSNIIAETNTLTSYFSIPIIIAVAELLTVIGLTVLLFALNPVAAAASNIHTYMYRCVSHFISIPRNTSAIGEQATIV